MFLDTPSRIQSHS